MLRGHWKAAAGARATDATLEELDADLQDDKPQPEEPTIKN